MTRPSFGGAWRHGWNALFGVLLFNVGLGCLAWLARAVLPDIAWLRFAVGGVLFVAVAPVIAWWAIRFVFPNAEALPTMHAVEVASFSDEASAHAAVGALAQGGVQAVVSSGPVGPQSGLPVPLGGIRVLVAQAHATEARALLAATRAHRLLE
jgi:hypothetical protein